MLRRLEMSFDGFLFFYGIKITERSVMFFRVHECLFGITLKKESLMHQLTVSLGCYSNANTMLKKSVRCISLRQAYRKRVRNPDNSACGVGLAIMEIYYKLNVYV